MNKFVFGDSFEAMKKRKKSSLPTDERTGGRGVEMGRLVKYTREINCTRFLMCGRQFAVENYCLAISVANSMDSWAIMEK